MFSSCCDRNRPELKGTSYSPEILLEDFLFYPKIYPPFVPMKEVLQENRRNRMRGQNGQNVAQPRFNEQRM